MSSPLAGGAEAVGAPPLLDTHLLLWAALHPERLSPEAAETIADRRQPVAYSVASLWEVAIKSSMARPDFTVDAAALRNWLLVEGFTEVPILPTHVLYVSHLPWHHRDPFDRLLVAQATIEGLTLWTADAAMQRYGSMVQLLA